MQASQNFWAQELYVGSGRAAECFPNPDAICFLSLPNSEKVNDVTARSCMIVRWRGLYSIWTLPECSPHIYSGTGASEIDFYLRRLP